MSDQTALFVFLGLLGLQLVAFFIGMVYMLTGSNKANSQVVRERAGIKSNFASGVGFACMSVLAFTVEHYVPAGDAWKTWMAGLVFMIFAAFLFWLGNTRRRALTQRVDSQ